MTVQRSYMAKKGQVKQDWFIADVSDQILGRIATEIAMVLMGKHRPDYTPHVDTGDYVVVINAEKIKMTGRKLEVRHYTWYTGYPGLKLESYGDRLERKPEDLIFHAVRRMLPKNKLAEKMMAKLKVYAGPEHPHQAQNPKPLGSHVKATA